ncbi:hypothetical protein E2C01_096509 [Portunus trituberculatus]|uniref:Uncharacterized protein n=1 Tax=Portunus trituberculatus TaxID=210409 RepID=A0A5B7K770_PORTR|nr:hypothetical protein [Portunus trituberculatus]
MERVKGLEEQEVREVRKRLERREETEGSGGIRGNEFLAGYWVSELGSSSSSSASSLPRGKVR